MKTLYLLVFTTLLVVFQSYGQSRKIHLPKHNGKTSTYDLWYADILKLSKKIGLKPLKDSPYKFHFRVWTENQVLDIWQNSQNIFSGSLTFWAKEYTYDDGPSRIFFEPYQVPNKTVLKVKKLIDSCKVLSISSDSEIKGWNQGCDGITYKLEFCDRQNYYFKTYWTPSVIENVPEAKTILHFILKIREKGNYERLWKVFAQKIPYYMYVIGDGSYARENNWSKEKINQYHQKRKEYLETLNKKKKRKR